MNNQTKAAWLAAGASLIAINCATNAAAQEEDRRRTIDELTDTIFVTATKSQDPEDVQDVPVAISAFNAGTLDALNVRDLEDLSFSAPNVSLDDIGTARGQANFSIRGLGVNSSIGSIDPAVGVFVDGVYLGVNSGVVFDIFDLESIEVLRGPQGILFGRNTTGGAVLINTANPTDEFQGKATYIVETPVDDNRGGINQYYMGTVSGPLVEGKLNGKFAAYYNDDNGYFENQFDGGNLGEADTKIIRGALEWFPTENLTFLGKAEFFDSFGDGPATQNRGTFDRDTFDISIDEVGFIDLEMWNFALRTDWELNFGTITNIMGYRDATQDTLGDIDSTPLFSFHSDTQSFYEQFSNELRYAGTWGKFDVKAGLFYFTQDIGTDENRNLPGATAPLPDVTFNGGGVQDQDVFGVFSQVDYNVTDSLILSGGLRFNYEQKEVRVAYVQPRFELTDQGLVGTTCSVIDNTCPVDDITSSGFTDDDAWQNLSPKLGFQWIPSGDTQVYGGWTRAFRSGGYNFRITDPAAFLNQVQAQTEIATDDEKVDSFELGTKLQRFDNRAQLNAAVFFTQIEAMQREVNLSDPTAGVSQLITNTADANIWGVEFEGQYLLTDSLLLKANAGYINDEYTEVRFDLNGDAVVNEEDENLAIPRVPEWTYGAALIHDLDLGSNGGITTTVAYQHRDEFAYTDNNWG